MNIVSGIVFCYPLDRKREKERARDSYMKRERKYPKSRFGWLWENMEGKRVLFIIALFGTALYNILQIVVPHFSRQLVDLFNQVQRGELVMSENESTFY